MIAFARIRRLLHLAEEGVHFLRLEPSAGAYRAMAGQRRGEAVEPVAHAGRAIPFGKFIGEVADEAGGIAVSCKAGRVSEVRICLTRNLEFRRCPDIDRNGCMAQRLVMPADR